jgi:hypothetical protein
VKGRRPEGDTRPITTSSSPWPVSSPPYHACTTASATVTSTSTAPALTSTSTSRRAGVTAWMADSSAFCTNGSDRLYRSRPSASMWMPSPRHNTTRSALAAAATASAKAVGESAHTVSLVPGWYVTLAPSSATACTIVDTADGMPL